MALAVAAAKVAGHGAATAATPSTGLKNEEILLLMVASAGMIFVDHARSGQPQPGNQFAAVGIVGFVLLGVGEFAPAVAFAFALLFFIAIVLNSPRGIPFIAASTPTTKKTTTTTGSSNAP